MRQLINAAAYLDLKPVSPVFSQLGLVSLCTSLCHSKVAVCPFLVFVSFAVVLSLSVALCVFVVILCLWAVIWLTFNEMLTVALMFIQKHQMNLLAYTIH